MKMSVASDERDLLMAAKAVEQQIITTEQLTIAVSKWTAGDYDNLLAALEAETELDNDKLKQLRTLFASLEDSLAMEIADSIEDSFFGKLNGALENLNDDRVRATVIRWQTNGSLPLAAVSENERFEVLSEHARGGLGEVLLARDRQLNRQVALKRIRDKWADHDQAKIRFQLEAEITGRLEHPGVVPVYALGQHDDGEVYYAMRFIRGQSLEAAVLAYHEARGTNKIDMRSADFRNLLHRFMDVCNTIGYAHSRGIIHRDLKPANIMLGKYGETLVVDWGLAKQIGVKEDTLIDHGESCISSDLGSGSAPTQFGSAVGTPQYMSPEQATGRVDRMGPATDVFGLGATLYFILTNQPPQKNDSLDAVLNRVEHGKFSTPTECESSVPAPLESICVKAMSRIPTDRYETATEMATDINNALAGQRVMAHKERPIERLRRWGQENQSLTRTILTTLLLLLVGTSAFGTAVVLNRQALVQQRVTSLWSEWNLRERLLSDGIEDLRQDILLLSKRPQLSEVAAAFAGGSAADVDRDNLAAEFEAVLGLNPDYMQVRLIGKDGVEKVRVDRPSPGGEPFRLADDQLQDKGGKAYFRDTRQMKFGDVYLSDINLNMENGMHQWNTPTLRAAAPIHSSQDGTFLGTVVMNMHFEHIAKALRPRDVNGDLLVYLTDQDGRFLFCSDVPGAEFCFERGLTCPIETVYGELGNFIASPSRHRLEQPDASARPTVWAGCADKASTAVSRVADEVMTKSNDVQVRVSRYDSKDVDREMLIATSDDESALQQLMTKFDTKVDSRELGRSVSSNHQALCAKKIFFDPGNPERFLCLVVGRPH